MLGVAGVRKGASPLHLQHFRGNLMKTLYSYQKQTKKSYNLLELIVMYNYVTVSKFLLAQLPQHFIYYLSFVSKVQVEIRLK